MLIEIAQEIHVPMYYDILKLWELPVEELEQPGREGLLPLMPLAMGGMSYKRVDEMIERLHESGREDLYAMAYSLAAFAFRKTEDRAWLRRRFHMLKDILEESWAYQEMMEEAKEKAIISSIELISIHTKVYSSIHIYTGCRYAATSAGTAILAILFHCVRIYVHDSNCTTSAGGGGRGRDAQCSRIGSTGTRQTGCHL